MKFSRHVLPIILLGLMVISFAVILTSNKWGERKIKEKKYTGLTLATVKSIDVISTLKFTESGNESFVSHRVVDYTYTIDNRSYSGQDIVPAKLRFKKINLRLVSDKSVYIKYDKNHPQNSIITREID